MYRSALTNNSLPWAEMLNFSSCSHQGSSADGRNGNSENFPSQTIAIDFSLKRSLWQIETSGIIPSSYQANPLPQQACPTYFPTRVDTLKATELEVWKVPPSFPAVDYATHTPLPWLPGPCR